MISVDFALTQGGCSDAGISLAVESARIQGVLDVRCLSGECFDGSQRVAPEAPTNVVLHPAHIDLQLLFVHCLWVGTVSQTQDIFKARDGFV